MAVARKCGYLRALFLWLLHKSLSHTNTLIKNFNLNDILSSVYTLSA